MINNFLLYFLMNFFSIIILIMIVLVGIAFLTLLERKILGYIQDRKGPNKVGLMGMFQPFSDAIKLFFKEVFIVFKSNQIIYFMCPLVSFMLMLMMWLIYPIITNIYFLNYSILIMIMIMSMSSYMLMMMGWSSNSIYSMIGSLRSVVQVLSYEVNFIMIILVLMILSESYSFIDFIKWQENFWYMMYLFPVFLMYMLSILAELNRSPMDFIEGESELVSGFNVEYFSGGFILIFMGEYGMIIFSSMVILLMFTNLLLFNMYMFIFVNLMSSLIIFMRGMLPRMRYDELMYLCWKIMLPLVLNYLFLILGIKCLFMLII